MHSLKLYIPLPCWICDFKAFLLHHLCLNHIKEMLYLIAKTTHNKLDNTYSIILGKCIVHAVFELCLFYGILYCISFIITMLTLYIFNWKVFAFVECHGKKPSMWQWKNHVIDSKCTPVSITKIILPFQPPTQTQILFIYLHESIYYSLGSFFFCFKLKKSSSVEISENHFSVDRLFISDLYIYICM